MHIDNVVILGGNGFIGKHLVSKLHRSNPAIPVVTRGVEDFDLADPAGVERLERVFSPSTAVVVCAGIKRQLGDTIDICRRNIAIASHVADAVQAQPVARLIFLSSAAVYGEENENTRITEQTPFAPTSYYGVAKLASEFLLKKAVAVSGGGGLVNIRPPLVYGPNDTGAIYGPGGFAQAALNRRPVTLWGDGDELRAFLLVGDLARILASMIFSDYSGPLNPAPEPSHTFRDVLDVIDQILPDHLEVVSRPRSKPKIDNAYDGTLLRHLLPKFTFTTLEEGIQQTIDFYRQASDPVRPTA